MIYFGRRISFSMGHRMHNSSFSDEENRRIFGKCNNPNGHGHSYAVEATFAAEIDPATGFSANLVAVDEVLRRELFDRFDHLDFNRDFPEFAEVISSGENLARVFWDLLAPHFPPEAPLVRVRVEETDKNSFEYFGERPVRPRSFW
jgi:6-pyruvoyltetrahydropterin/6-carboxytetrahydropterin synthase